MTSFTLSSDQCSADGAFAFATCYQLGVVLKDSAKHIRNSDDAPQNWSIAPKFTTTQWQSGYPFGCLGHIYVI